ncbi:MAG: glycosyltransferase [Gemmatimonadaceae bacterium]
MRSDTIAANARTASTTSHCPLIVHSHLRWDWVWQRPQQLLSRLATHAAVLFVEEPVFLDDVDAPSFALSTPMPGVTRAIPQLPARLRDNADAALEAVRATLERALVAEPELVGRFRDPVQWFYTPMPAPVMLGAFGERGVVYDCMDELSKFRFAPKELLDREGMLLARADVVFTGGYKLYESKARHHDNVHFFGCGVDAAHFARARAAGTALPDDVATLTHPVLGYFGVIDERLDYDLLRAVAEALPEAQLVMVGPMAKVDPRELPHAANVHWLGQRAYEQLPAYVKAFDVCLMPFALNEATEYINPTKTLEYMAAAKPIVSTAVADVIRNFTPVVRVAGSTSEFIAAVRTALDSLDPERIAAGVEQAQRASWESIVGEMRRLIADAVAPAFTAIPTVAAREAKRGTARRSVETAEATAGD